jgi:MFS transporter, ACS family, DAL5 transporter family protein
MASTDVEAQSPNPSWDEKKSSQVSPLADTEQDDQFITTVSTELRDDPFFIRSLKYSTEEEASVVRILDTRLFPWILVTTFVLNMDRTNHSNAISDNLPADLGFDINGVNTGLVIYGIFFGVFTVSGSVIAKLVGSSKWISILMFAWSLVTLSHALIHNRK